MNHTSSSPEYLRRNKRVREQAQVTPWRDFWEFQRVRTSLIVQATSLLQENKQQQHGSDSSLFQSVTRALERYCIWEARFHKLPHAVESTAALAQVTSHDAHRKQAPLPRSSDWPMRVPFCVPSTDSRISYNKIVLRLPCEGSASSTLLDYFDENYWKPLFTSRQKRCASRHVALVVLRASSCPQESGRRR